MGSLPKVEFSANGFVGRGVVSRDTGVFIVNVASFFLVPLLRQGFALGR